VADAIKIRITGIEETTDAMRSAVHQGLVNTVEKAGNRGVQLIVPLTPVASGHLANAMQVDFGGGGHLITAMIFAGPPADVYAAPVETGTRPHFPPPAALLPWVKQRFSPSSEKEALSIAFAIARAIAKRGTKGSFMFDKTQKQLELEVPGIAEAEVAAAIAAAGLGGEP
jgi:hypothetical protein